MQRSFQHDQQGAGGIVAALREAHAKPGTIVCFEVADHPTRGNEVYRRANVGFTTLEGMPTWRYVGEGNDLDGNGSHALLPTWERDQSIEHAAAALAIALLGMAPAGAWIFRVPLVASADVVELESRR